MDSYDFYKTMKKAIKTVFAIEKIIKFKKAIDDLSDGIEEIEKSFKITKSKKHDDKTYWFSINTECMFRFYLRLILIKYIKLYYRLTI